MLSILPSAIDDNVRNNDDQELNLSALLSMILIQRAVLENA
jgi:hypothetical protein